MKREDLHDYQVYACEFLKTHPICALLLDMGLGKSIITLTAILDLMLDSCEVNRALIIAPLRVARDTWPNEIAKWEHLKPLTVSPILGSKKERIEALHTNAMVYTINRENLVWLVNYYETNRLRWNFDFVVIDELSGFKSHTSKRWKALRKIRPRCSRIVGLTGTPAPNSLLDLWAEIGALDMGQRLGKFIGQYREVYFKPGSRNPQTGIVYSYVPKAGAEEQIYDRISDICISMKARDYLKMPDCIYSRHEVKMSSSEKRLYDQLKQDLLIPLAGGDIEAANAGSLSMKLLQMANGAVYDENGAVREIHNRKLEALEDLIESANGQNVLVAYWYKHDRERILKHLGAKKIPVRELKSSEDMEDWNCGRISVALIHPASAGHGLNIQDGGHILIWYGLTWSLELYQQTVARLWRQGQKDVVSVIHIVTQGTVDEDVLKSLDKKDVSQERLIAAVRAQLYGG